MSGFPRRAGSRRATARNRTPVLRLWRRALAAPPPAAALSHSHLSWLHVDRRIYRMTVTLDGIQPPIWRRLEGPSRVTMAKLHELLQAAFGWTDSHLHVFEIGAERIGVPHHLDQLMEGQITRSGRLRQTPRDPLRPAAPRVRRDAEVGRRLRARAIRPGTGERGACRCAGLLTRSLTLRQGLARCHFSERQSLFARSRVRSRTQPKNSS